MEYIAEVQLYAAITLIVIHLLTAAIYLVKCIHDRIKRGFRRMSDLSSAVESMASSSIASMTIKTTLIGGAGVGAVNAVAEKVPEDAKSIIQYQLMHISEYALTPADICQVIATLWILSQAYLAIKKLIAEKKKPKPKPEKEPIRTMGGSGGGGPEEETEKQD